MARTLTHVDTYHSRSANVRSSWRDKDFINHQECLTLQRLSIDRTVPCPRAGAGNSRPGVTDCGGNAVGLASQLQSRILCCIPCFYRHARETQRKSWKAKGANITFCLETHKPAAPACVSRSTPSPRHSARLCADWSRLTRTTINLGSLPLQKMSWYPS